MDTWRPKGPPVRPLSPLPSPRELGGTQEVGARVGGCEWMPRELGAKYIFFATLDRFGKLFAKLPLKPLRCLH